MLFENKRKTLRHIGEGACMITIPKATGFLPLEEVLLQQLDSNTLVLRKLDVKVSLKSG